MDERTGQSTEVQRDVTGSDDGAIDGTGVYEIQDGVVFYDTENPLAWVQADKAVSLREMA